MRDDQETTAANRNTDGRLDAVDPLVGCVLSGKYRILEKIGAGGMSIVYKAHDQLLDRTVAIKCLSGDVQEEGLTRFRREGIATGKLESPHIVNVHELFLAPEQNPYLVMDYVDGEPLSNIIRRTGALTVKRAVHIISQAAQALEHAHSRGIVHRDIKPSNMIVTTLGGDPNFVKIVDFGIAKLQTLDDHVQQQLTRAGDVFGSPIYMSPEQCSGLPADARSDIYSLGCVFYEMLVGEPPLLGANSLQTMRKHVDQLPLKPSEIRTIKDLTPNIESVLMRCLQKEPINRYQNLRAFVNELSRADAPTLSPGFSLPGRAHPYWVPIAVGLGLCGFAFLKYFAPAPPTGTDSIQTDTNQLSGPESEVATDTKIANEATTTAKDTKAPTDTKAPNVAKTAIDAKPTTLSKSTKEAKAAAITKTEPHALPKTEKPKPTKSQPATAKHVTELEAEQKLAQQKKMEIAAQKHPENIASLPAPTSPNPISPKKNESVLDDTSDGHELKEKLDAAAFDNDSQDYASAVQKYHALLPLAAKVYGENSKEYAAIVEKSLAPANHLDDTASAEKSARKALAIHERNDSPSGMARVYGWLGWLAHKQNKDNDALAYFKKSYALGHKIPHTVMMYADLLKSLKRYPEAEKEYLEALHEADTGPSHVMGRPVLRHLEDLYKEWGRPEKAQELKSLEPAYFKKWGM
jgi:serine/threonine protein kinase